MRKRALAILCGITAFSATELLAQKTYTTGLSNPSKLVLITGGYLMVTEAATDKVNTGKVTLVAPGGTKHTVFDGLPSANGDGPNGLALKNRTLYIALGEGDTLVTGPRQGTQVANPAGPSSPIFCTILKVRLDRDMEQVRGTFVMTMQQQFSLIDGNEISMKDGAGATATVHILTHFRPALPDPKSIYRNCHPYGLAIMPSIQGELFMADAGNNAIWEIDSSSGKAHVLTRFADVKNPGSGPPTVEPVPDSIHVFGNQLLVTLLTGAPFLPNVSSVVSVDPRSGKTSTFISGLTSAIDLAFMDPGNGTRPTFFVLQFSLNLGGGAPGQLLRYDNTSSRVFVDRLAAPDAIALDPAARVVYVASRATGEITTIPL